ncbi:polysaccharide pyruvyl transferase family protein [Bosea sp. 117]|uniref:polysaccharide pyruvyl transferase family protein n=1 Tax=Bosea sp. 117 TaxID=1125973 RepID=UPI000494C745|nr:polysaccharide pyruvyl transferase family protein [Bosea sp. 117]
MRTFRNRVAFFGLFGTGNSGNDGSFEAMLSFLRRVRPDAEAICICSGPDYVRRTFDVRTVSIGGAAPGAPARRAAGSVPGRLVGQLGSFWRALRVMRECDALIMPGTGVLDDFGDGPFGVPLALLGWCVAARLAGARIAFVSVGAGPIKARLGRLFARLAAGLAHYRSYRDAVSKDFMTGIGVDTRSDHVVPDLAFALPAPSRQERSGDAPLTVGLGVMAYYGWRNDRSGGAALHARYVGQIVRFARALLREGYRVRLLTGDTADRDTLDEIMSALVDAGHPPDEVATAPINSLHDVMQQMARTDVVVATRYHNVVCALRMHRPVISIGYAAKNDVLLGKVGLAGFCQHIEALDLELLTRQFAELVASRAELEAQIGAAVDGFRRRLAAQEDALLAGVLARPFEAAISRQAGGG